MGHKASTSEYLLASLSLLASLAIIGWLFVFSQYGFESTDEAAYLVWMSQPSIYAGFVSQYGFIYHPLYQLVDGNIALLRQANLCITYLLACTLIAALLTQTPLSKTLSTLSRYTLIAGFATSAFLSLVFVYYWLPTPSYNTLIFQALLIVGIGLLLAQRVENTLSLAGWMIIGAGGWLAFMAKPSSSLALAVFVALYLFFSKKMNYRLLFIACLTAILFFCISADLIDGSVFAFIQRLKTGVLFAGYLDAGHNLFDALRVDVYELSIRDKQLLLGTSVISIVSVLLISSRMTVLQQMGMGFVLLIFMLMLSMMVGLFPVTLGGSSFQGLSMWAFPLAGIFLILFITPMKTLSKIRVNHWALIALFMIFPLIYAFGTTNNYWSSAGSAAFFWVLPVILLLVPVLRQDKAWKILLPLALSMQLLVVTLLMSSAQTPYRQTQGLQLNDAMTSIGEPGSMLKLSAEWAEFYQHIKTVSAEAGFQQGTPMIDLTGVSPGILYHLQAKSIGQAWMIGGYPGSDHLAIETLKTFSCHELTTAWVLISENSARKISSEILHSFGLDLEDHYLKAAEWVTPSGFSGQAEPMNQVLMKPILSGPVALNLCNNNRYHQSDNK